MPISTHLQEESFSSQQSPMMLVPNSLDALLTMNQLMAIGEQRKSGLILCKNHHAEFAGPGAAVGSPAEQNYCAVIAIGSPNLVPVTTSEERQKAYSRRIQWGRWLNRIVDNSDPILRAEKLFSSFEEFFGYQVAANLPDHVLAMLVGVLPQTIQLVRMQHRGANKSAGGVQAMGGSAGKAGEITIKYYNPALTEESKLWESSLSLTNHIYPFSQSA
jgi:hypothetical protein